MRSLAIVFIAFVLCTFMASGQAADNLTDPVRDALAKYDRAWNAKDSETVAEMLDDSYVYFSSTGTLTNKKSTLEFLAKPDYKLTSVTRSEHKLHSYDGKVAVVSSRWQGKGSWSGGEINDDQRCGQVFVKRGKAWKLVSEHCVQIASK
ncbi:MAG: nuclear transport factor 2 family protein [Pyrinomonadaceae bacterium]